MREGALRISERHFNAVLLITALYCGSVIPARAELQAGAAKADITPDVKVLTVSLGGYAARRGAPATGVHDPVYAHALVLANGKDKVGLVSLDLCFLPANIKAAVVEKLKTSGVVGLDNDHLLLCATHTHSAPDPLAMHSSNTFALKGWTPFDQKLLDFTIEKIAAAITQADKNLRPAKIGWLVKDATGFNRNRRGDKIVDSAMTLLRVDTLDNHPVAAVVDFAAHPTLYGDEMREISADWPGVMADDVEKKQGLGSVCLFLNGAEGDASPNVQKGKSEADNVTDFGHKMSAFVLEALPAIPLQPDVSLRAWTQTVTLPPRKPNAMFLLAASQLGATFAQARQLVNTLMPENTHIGFVQIGKLLFMGFPCEPSGALGLQAKAAARKAGFATPAVIALSNEWLAYALTPEQYKEGKYESSMSFYGDQFGPALLTGLRAGLKR